MSDIYDEQALEDLEESEHALTEEALLAMFALLLATHKELENELRLFYQRYGTDGVVTYAQACKWTSDKDHRRRITNLYMLVNTKFDSLFSSTKDKFEDMILKVMEKEFSFFGVELDDVDVRWGVDNLTWLHRLENDVRKWNAVVLKDIKQAILKRRNIDQVLTQLDKRFVSMEKVLRGLGITETTAVGSITRNGIFKELGISKYRYYAREDERTCDECGALHGLVFPMSAFEVGVTASPLHTHCRCWEVPIRD